MLSEQLPHELYYASVTVLGCIYLSIVYTFNEIRKFVSIADLSDQFLKSRQPTLQIAYVLTFLFLLYILHPITIFVANIYGANNVNIALLLNDAADIVIFLTLWPRAWILWLNQALVDSLKNWMWRREVNPQDANLLVRHRQYFKHSHALIYALFFVSVAPTYAALNVLSHSTAHTLICRILSASLLIICWLATMKIASSICVVTDEYSIREELLASLKSTGVIYVSTRIAFDIAVAVLVDHPNSVEWALLAEISCLSVAHLFVVYYAVYWTRNEYVLDRQIDHLSRLRDTGRSMSVSSFNAYFSQESEAKFEEIMNERSGVEAFCSHLMEEHGLENVLFLLEVTQFKAVIQRFTGQKIVDNGIVGEARIFSAHNILDIHWLPVDPRMFCQSPHQIALGLYDKYVEESADLCINVSFVCRRAIYRYFHHLSQETHRRDSLQDIEILISKSKDDEAETVYDETHPLVKLYRVFDDAFVAIWSLVKGDSFLRFTETEAFRRLVSVLFPKASRIAHKHLIDGIHAELQQAKKSMSAPSPVSNSRGFTYGDQADDNGKAHGYPPKPLKLIAVQTTSNTHTTPSEEASDPTTSTSTTGVTPEADCDPESGSVLTVP
eukprot:CAMPEP_0197032256 /NCGR_PEP_ID=MMETSP1384-20130603/10977_1 /TAXON_ID=29189 /ORGANISM="Ammonia sp." /LENGTH=610 /DNA_ID=CAMNT_0042461889 /DNA_START=92 /DNA_END=1924 /DNA_ORIENTATION=+